MMGRVIGRDWVAVVKEAAACVAETAEADIRAWRGDTMLPVAPVLTVVLEPVDRVCAMACSRAGDMPATAAVLLLFADDCSWWSISLNP